MEVHAPGMARAALPRLGPDQRGALKSGCGLSRAAAVLHDQLPLEFAQSTNNIGEGACTLNPTSATTLSGLQPPIASDLPGSLRWPFTGAILARCGTSWSRKWPPERPSQATGSICR